jgi:hypothetical protein
MWFWKKKPKVEENYQRPFIPKYVQQLYEEAPLMKARIEEEKRRKMTLWEKCKELKVRLLKGILSKT